MRENMNTRLYGWFYSSVCKMQLKRKYGNKALKSIKKEYRAVIRRAKDIGSSKLLSAYCMAAWFIALNRETWGDVEENYELFRESLLASKLFHKAMGNADAYLDKKKLSDRLKWAAESKQKKYENDWVLDVLEGNAAFDLGYDYFECGVCKLCQDENCFELAKYLCRLDFVMADMMGMELKRTMTLAEGGKYCDFRYRRKHCNVYKRDGTE